MRELAQFAAAHPQDYQQLNALGERLLALAHQPEDSPEVERLVAVACELFRHNAINTQMMGFTFASTTTTPLAEDLFAELVNDSLSPAQRRFFALMEQVYGNQSDNTDLEQGVRESALI